MLKEDKVIEGSEIYYEPFIKKIKELVIDINEISSHFQKENLNNLGMLENDNQDDRSYRSPESKSYIHFVYN